MTRIIIADDHPVFRLGLVQLVQKEADLKVIFEAGDGEEVISFLSDEKNEADVVILDINLPGRDGIDTLKEIKKFRTRLPVIIFSAHKEEVYGVRAIRAGASAYISKEDTATVIAEVIRKVKGGKSKYISPALAELLADELDRSSDKPLHELLSDREFEIMKLIALGNSVSEIASSLSLSVNTVNTYRARLLSKMGMTSNTQLALYALENGLLG